MGIYLEQIRTAWGAMEPWMKKDFPAAVMKYVAPEQVSDYPDFTFYEQKISRFEGIGHGVVVETPTTGALKLRIDFSVLEVSGKIKCKAFELENPSFTNSMSNGTLDWDIDATPPLAINELSIVGAQSVAVDMTRTRWSGWLGDMGKHARYYLERDCNLLQSKRFCQTLTGILYRTMLQRIE